LSGGFEAVGVPTAATKFVAAWIRITCSTTGPGHAIEQRPSASRTRQRGAGADSQHDRYRFAADEGAGAAARPRHSVSAVFMLSTERSGPVSRFVERIFFSQLEKELRPNVEGHADAFEAPRSRTRRLFSLVSQRLVSDRSPTRRKKRLAVGNQVLGQVRPGSP